MTTAVSNPWQRIFSFFLNHSDKKGPQISLTWIRIGVLLHTQTSEIWSIGGAATWFKGWKNGIWGYDWILSNISSEADCWGTQQAAVGPNAPNPVYPWTHRKFHIWVSYTMETKLIYLQCVAYCFAHEFFQTTSVWSRLARHWNLMPINGNATSIAPWILSTTWIALAALGFP